MIGTVSPQRVSADERLMAEMVEMLERTGCSFWACKGPTPRPEPMITCGVCDMLARLRRRLGRPIRDAH